jgi:hypothetical protein
MRNVQLFRALSLALGMAGLQTACVAHATATGSAEADAPVVFVETPTLVEIDGGVWVVRDCDRPVYFVDDTYWVYRDDVWYRSRSYDGGWVVVEVTVVPTVIVHRDHTKYVHYHGSATAQTRMAPHGDSAVAAGNPHGGPPGHSGDTPGVGNERKEAGEQPGQVPHAGEAGKNEPSKKDGKKKDDKKD